MKLKSARRFIARNKWKAVILRIGISKDKKFIDKWDKCLTIIKEANYDKVQ